MYKNWNDIVNDFPTIPYLFVGSGLTKRYYNLPSWGDLLKHFIKIISDDEFAYQYYLDKCGQKFEAVGTLLEKDFNEKWFNTPSIRSTAPDVARSVREGVSPFKAEVSEYIKQQSLLQEKYSEEIGL